MLPNIIAVEDGVIEINTNMVDYHDIIQGEYDVIKCYGYEWANWIMVF